MTATANGRVESLRAEELRRELDAETDPTKRLRLAEQIDREHGITSYAVSDSQPTTWSPIPLDEILTGDYAPPAPTMLARTDGECLLYEGRSHTVSAEPEALKTWLALGATAEQLAAGNQVLYIDFEASAVEIVGRLRALGIDAEVIRHQFSYVRPDEPLADRSLADLDAALARQPTLCVIDGVTEAFSRQGLSPLDNGDVAIWLDLLPRRVTRAGCAVMQLDHVVKDREARGRYAIGAQHKLAGVDVAYSMHVIEPFGRGRDGTVEIKVQKDRPGGIRAYAQDGHVATLRAHSYDDGRVSIALIAPDRDTPDTFRPTGLMEKASKALEADPGLSSRALRSTVGGKAEYVDLALEILISEDYIHTEHGPRNSTKHFSVKPYRQETDTVSPPRPDRVPDTVSATVSRVPTPIGGTRSRSHDTDNDTTDRVPDEDLLDWAEHLHAKYSEEQA